MLSSLNLALSQVAGPLIVSYSDIIYSPAIIQDLCTSSEDFAIAYDPNWLDLWSLRFPDPLSDAETFSLSNSGYLSEIGLTPHTKEAIEGQFVGLLKFSQHGVSILQSYLKQNPHLLSSADTTSLLSQLISLGIKIMAIPISDFWFEIDSSTDLKLASDTIPPSF